MIYGILVFSHIFICVSLIMIVLLQAGKGAGLGNLLGGGGGDQLLSAPSGSAFMKKITTGLAVGFVLTSLLLTISASRRNSQSLMQQLPMASPSGTR